LTTEPARTASLSKILGFGFSIALAFGGTVGVGILRLPGIVAAALGDTALIVLVWIVGGIYATLGAISIAELAAMMPTAGGFYVYARRTFGSGLGFVVGWNDWLLNSLTIAYGALTAADFIGVLLPSLAAHGQGTALLLLGLFTTLHLFGLRIGSGMQNAISALVGALLVGLALASFMVVAPRTALASSAPLPTAASLPLLSVGMFAALVTALRSVIVAYDGWYNSIYLAEETVDAARTVPRAIISCALMVTGLYLLINAGFLHALSLPVLAASVLPAADVARAILPRGGAEFVTVISIGTLLSLLNATLLGAPRILYAIGRDGLFSGSATRVTANGTPSVALAITSAVAGLLLILSGGELKPLLAIAAVLFVLNYVTGYSAVIVLRRREPGLERPFRAWGFPWTTGLVLLGSVLFLVAAVVDDPLHAVFAVLLIAIAAPVYWWIIRTRRAAAAAS
jgi:basic amino acid/polyamine antiporter, APA family